MEFATYIEEQHTRIRQGLEALLATRPTLETDLVEEARYAVLGGKHLRGIFAMEIYKTLGGKDDESLNPALLVELVQSSSLIIDDLPAMDDEETRRGRVAFHRVYGEADTILLSHYLDKIGQDLLSRTITAHQLYNHPSFTQLSEKTAADDVRDNLNYRAIELIAGQQRDRMLRDSEKSRETISKKLIAMRQKNAIWPLAGELPMYLLRMTNQRVHVTELGTAIGKGYQLHDDESDKLNDPDSIYQWPLPPHEIQELKDAAVASATRAASFLPKNPNLSRIIDYAFTRQLPTHK